AGGAGSGAGRGRGGEEREEGPPGAVTNVAPAGPGRGSAGAGPPTGKGLPRHLLVGRGPRADDPRRSPGRRVRSAQGHRAGPPRRRGPFRSGDRLIRAAEFSRRGGLLPDSDRVGAGPRAGVPAPGPLPGESGRPGRSPARLPRGGSLRPPAGRRAPRIRRAAGPGRPHRRSGDPVAASAPTAAGGRKGQGTPGEDLPAGAVAPTRANEPRNKVII